MHLSEEKCIKCIWFIFNLVAKQGAPRKIKYVAYWIQEKKDPSTLPVWCVCITVVLSGVRRACRGPLVLHHLGIVVYRIFAILWLSSSSPFFRRQTRRSGFVLNATSSLNTHLCFELHPRIWFVSIKLSKTVKRKEKKAFFRGVTVSQAFREADLGKSFFLISKWKIWKLIWKHFCHGLDAPRTSGCRGS